MKRTKRTILAFILLAILVIATGCSTNQKDQIITVQKRVGDQEYYENIKTIEEEKQVRKAKEIIDNAVMVNHKGEMGRHADYQFQFPSKDSSEGKIASYLVWVNPNDENLELVTESESKNYVKLPEQDSKELYTILTGENLAE